MKKQVWTVHGGDTFKSYTEYLKFLKEFEIDIKRDWSKGWKSNLGEKLGNNYSVMSLSMPNAFNAKYLEWKIWFEKYIPFMKSPIILLGHSLGGIFLAKYLSENKLKKKIAGAFLVAAPFNDRDSDYSLGDFKLKKNLSLITKQCSQVFFYQSQDDDVVPFVDLGKYQKALPEAAYRIFKNRGHFIGSSFPEIVRDIKNLK
jgi:predicted alpha/beta hydrolase family esterase